MVHLFGLTMWLAALIMKKWMDLFMKHEVIGMITLPFYVIVEILLGTVIGVEFLIVMLLSLLIGRYPDFDTPKYNEAVEMIKDVYNN